MNNPIAQTWQNEVTGLFTYNATGSSQSHRRTGLDAGCLVTITINQGTGSHNTRISMGSLPTPDITITNAATIIPFPVPDVTLSLPERLSSIDRILGFNVSDLSRILQVERRSIYNWKAGLTSSLQHRTEERLSQIESLASSWNTLSAQPLVFARNEPIGHPGTSTLIEALSASEPDFDLIQAVLPYLAKHITDIAKNKRRKQNAAIKKALHEVKLPTSEEIAAKLNARARHFQSDQYTDD